MREESRARCSDREMWSYTNPALNTRETSSLQRLPESTASRWPSAGHKCQCRWHLYLHLEKGEELEAIREVVLLLWECSCVSIRDRAELCTQGWPVPAAVLTEGHALHCTGSRNDRVAASKLTGAGEAMLHRAPGRTRSQSMWAVCCNSAHSRTRLALIEAEGQGQYFALYHSAKSEKKVHEHFSSPHGQKTNMLL